VEIDETVRELVGEMSLEELGGGGSIDSGAEEELFRRAGQQAAGKLLVERWQEADVGAIVQCEQCRESMKPIGRRKKTLQTVCGAVEINRRVYYCAQCRQTKALLDRRLGVESSGMTPGLMRLVCRTALELPYQQSERLLNDTLGFTPCSAREIERIAKQHGQRIEKSQFEEGPAEPVRKRRRQRKVSYCLAIDGVMIPGLPDAQEHRLNWHDVKVAVMTDRRGIENSIYVAGREDAATFGRRLWHRMESFGLGKENFALIVGDGAPWIWNLAEMHLPGVPHLLDFYHAAEHLYATAELVWGEEKNKENWWRRRLEQLKEGRLTGFFFALKRLVRVHGDSDSNNSPKRLLQYFTDNRTRLRYQWAAQNNLPIGSGSVESAARHIVQQRLKQSGMRWSDPGAQSILNLRTVHRNGEFEQYWEDYAVSGF
jgi:uncharacterized protein UPF0236